MPRNNTVHIIKESLTNTGMLVVSFTKYLVATAISGVILPMEACFQTATVYNLPNLS